MKIAICTGGYDPIHSGHIEYFNAASKLADMLIVGINSDAWLTRKKGRAFMPMTERKTIIENLMMVNEVVEFEDHQNNSVDCIDEVLKKYPLADIIFVNGGDRNHTNVPEQDAFKNNPRVSFVFGVGGENKQNSSRWILDEWRAPKTNRPWGNYRVIHETSKTFKVKELNVDPRKTLSMQRHEHRSEMWFVSEGYASVYTLDNHTEKLIGVFGEHQDIWLSNNEWHRLANETDAPLKIVEIQYGNECTELDIFRR